MLVYLITVLLFLLFFRRIAHCRKSYNLWLDYDFYLPNSETPSFSRQTVVAEQIKAPSFFLRKHIYYKISKILIT